MRIVVISDTHEQNLNTKWQIPVGDVLIHAGDATARGKPESLRRFGAQMQQQPHRFKLFVPGNHDRLFADKPKLATMILSFFGVITLIDESIVLPGGLHMYGTPWIQDDPSHFAGDVASFMTRLPGHPDNTPATVWRTR
jgi:predicted phosphodiesterase